MEATQEATKHNFEPRSAIRILLNVFMRAMMEWYGFKENEGDQLKASKGLQAVFIDMSRFNTESIIRGGLLPKMFVAIFNVLSGVTKAKRDYIKTMKSRPGKSRHASPDFWEKMKKKASSLGIGVVGFAPVDENLVFRNDHVGKIGVLYENGIVLGMEMDFEAIDRAPEAVAGVEAMRVYGALGKATNALADFVRSHGFKAIACHPLGGPVLYPAMAEKANVGQLGKLGLLITKEYGPRLRLSMIATNASPLPEKPDEHFGILDFCNKCGLCIRTCPAGAIYKEPQKRQNGLYSCIQQEKCFPQFYEKDGCSVCIKVCPFHSKGYHQVMRSRIKQNKISRKPTSRRLHKVSDRARKTS